MTDLLQKLVALQLQNAGERSSLSNGAVLDSSGEGDKLLDSNEIMELSNEIDGVDEPATRTASFHKTTTCIVYVNPLWQLNLTTE
ncbi:hypothetical protein EB796_024728 [Bugula neritina]|uniref:Uncharacterized protein n=1 Tax=Bugula neritina TaxID=10212 RepID=A0A7J7ITW0_BUGNE|nr:hypothetical protein EB796_024728 [Bugula neritina]